MTLRTPLPSSGRCVLPSPPQRCSHLPRPCPGLFLNKRSEPPRQADSVGTAAEAHAPRPACRLLPTPLTLEAWPPVGPTLGLPAPGPLRLSSLWTLRGRWPCWLQCCLWPCSSRKRCGGAHPAGPAVHPLVLTSLPRQGHGWMWGSLCGTAVAPQPLSAVPSPQPLVSLCGRPTACYLLIVTQVHFHL